MTQFIHKVKLISYSLCIKCGNNPYSSPKLTNDERRWIYSVSKTNRKPELYLRYRPNFRTKNPIALISNYAELATFSMRKYMEKDNHCKTCRISG